MLRLAGAGLRIESDVELPLLDTPLFQLFWDHRTNPDGRLIFREFGVGGGGPPLTALEKESARRIVGFRREWCEKPVLRSEFIRRDFESCIEDPDQSHVAMNWGRLVFRDFRRNRVSVHYPAHSRNEFAGPLFLARLRNHLSPLLASCASLMIHGAAVRIRDRVALLLAPDGGGKTTAIQLSSGRPVLSDDHVTLTLGSVPGHVIVHGTPFGTVCSTPDAARLGGIFLLKKASAFSLTELEPRVALRFIWNDNRLKWFTLSRSLRKRCLTMIGTVVGSAACFQLEFHRDFIDWNSIDTAMSADV